MGVTADGFHYPELSDAPDGPAALFQLASDIDALFPVGVGAWTAFTPTITQSTAVSFNATTARCRYYKVNRWVHARYYLPVTSAGVTANVIALSLPVTAAGSEDVGGDISVFDASANNNHIGYVQSNGAGGLAGVEIAGLIGATFALANGDVIRANIDYESAA